MRLAPPRHGGRRTGIPPPPNPGLRASEVSGTFFRIPNPAGVTPACYVGARVFALAPALPPLNLAPVTATVQAALPVANMKAVIGEPT